MTIEQLREFVILAEERNYLVAADMLFSTQATLSRHIMAMEEELGFLLFNRSTKKIELTQEGSRFLLYARRAVRLQDAYKTALDMAHRDSKDVLHVGYNALVTFYRFTERLSGFMAAYPDVQVEIRQDEPDALLRAVQIGECDLAFLQENPFQRCVGVKRRRFASDTMVAVLPARHPLAGKKNIALQELEKESFITSGEDREPASVFIEACRRAGFTPKIKRAGIVGHALYDWVGGGECVALDWKAPALTHSDSRIVLVDVTPRLKSYSVAIYRGDRLTAVTERLLEAFDAPAAGNGAQA